MFANFLDVSAPTSEEPYLQSREVCMHAFSVAQLCPTLCNPMDCSPPGSSVYGIFQARKLEWVAISFSRGSFQSRDWTCISCIGRRILYHWATWEAPRQVYVVRIIPVFPPPPAFTHATIRGKRRIPAFWGQLSTQFSTETSLWSLCP